MTRRRLLTALGSTIVMAALLTTGGYAYSSWAVWPTAQVPFYINPANADVTPEAAEAALQSAAAAWSTQTHASVSLYYAGRTSDTAVANDLKSTVMFRSDANGGTLATTYAWASDGKIVDADMVFWDGGFTFFTGDAGCTAGAYIEDVATHEFGHVLGLLHSSDVDATMYPYYTLCSTAPRSLGADDIAGIESLYPPASKIPPQVAIVNPLNGTALTQGVPVSFAGQANDPKDGDVTPRIEWTSNVDGALGVGGSLLKTLSVGTHLVTAKVTDSQGLTGASEIAVTVAPGCVRGAPVVTLAPNPVSVPVGVSQAYTVNVLNSDSAACSASRFNMTRAVPAGWTSSLASAALSIAAGASASTTMSVTAPIGTIGGQYTVSGVATNSSALEYAGAGSAVETVTTDLAVTVATDDTAYIRGEPVVMTAVVRLGVQAVASAKVILTLTKPDGSTQRYTPTTNSTGLAKQTVKIGNTWPRGTYTLTAAVTKNGLSGAAATSFVVN